MKRRETILATQRRERPATNGPTSGRLSSEEAGGPVRAAEPPADPLIALYQRAAEEDLRARRRFERRLASAERHKQKKAGHLGELSVTLDIPRRYWPAVHRAAVKLGVPIRTERLAREQTTPLRITTSQSGALQLSAALDQQRGAE